MEIESELARYRTHNSWLFLPLRSRGRDQLFFCSFVCRSRLWSERSIHAIDMCVVFRSSLFLWSFHPLVAVGRSICGTHWAKINGRTFLTDKQEKKFPSFSKRIFSFFQEFPMSQKRTFFPPSSSSGHHHQFFFPSTQCSTQPFSFFCSGGK